MSADRRFRRAREVVRRSGVAHELEQELRAGTGGAPRRLSVEVLLAACITVNGRYHKAANLVDIRRVLTKKLTASEQFRIGTRWHQHGQIRKLTIRQVRYLFKRICTVLDYSPHTAAHLSSEERAEREEYFIAKINDLLRASLPRDLPTSETSALDATSIRTYSQSRGRHPSSAGEADFRSDTSAFARQRTASHDPDGRWAHQTETHRNSTDKGFGFTGVVGSSVYPRTSPLHSLHLVQMMTVLPNGYNKATPNLRLIDTYIKNSSLSRLIVDRGLSDWLPHTWAEPLRERGIEQVLDLSATSRGARPDPTTGVLMIDGWPCAPWTPKHLHNIPRPPHLKLKKPRPRARADKKAAYDKNLAKLTAFKKAQAELAKYALQPNTSTRPDGSRQFKTPAYGRDKATAAQRRTKVFKQATIVLPAAVCSKIRQHHRWGSDEWIDDYYQRPAIEGTFGNIKRRTGEALDYGWISVVGIVPVTLMTVFAAVHYNLRMARKWARKNNFHSDDLLLARKKARTAPPATPAPCGATGPPQAA